MSTPVIHIQNLCKHYRLGLIGGTSFREEFSRWWAKKLNRPDPWSKIYDTNHANMQGGHIFALNDVSFDVQEGEVLGIIGRNGAGKSTVLKILSKITSPTSGTAYIKGRVGSLLEVGTGFHGELTGRENIYLNGTILGMTKSEVSSKLEEIIEFAGVCDYIDTPVKRYSSGMTVRLAFAVAAHLEPEILIVDEVLAVGDAGFQRKCISKLKSVTNEGRTVLFVSHNMAAIQNLCTRCLLLSNGKLEYDGNPGDAVTYYLNQQSTRELPNLRDKPRELGSQLIRFTDVMLLNSKRVLVSALKTGEFGIIRLGFIRTTDAPLRNVSFGVAISNEFGERITQLNTDYLAQNITELPQNCNYIDVIISKLPIIAGRYFLTLGVSVNGVTSDWILDAATIDIEQGDYFGTGKVLPKGNGYMNVDHFFEIGNSKITFLDSV